MKIYLGCSAQKVLDYAEYYVAARDAILSSGNSITRDWIPSAIQSAKNKTDTSDRSHMYDDVMRSILEADLNVFDCSIPAMSVGHQITFSIEKEKPTLILVHKKHKAATSLFLAGADSPYLIFRDYITATDCKKIVTQFLKEKEPTSKVRFNLVLERELDNFIEWTIFKRKITKTDAIKSMIKSGMIEDKEYTDYLKDKK